MIAYCLLITTAVSFSTSVESDGSTAGAQIQVGMSVEAEDRTCLEFSTTAMNSDERTEEHNAGNSTPCIQITVQWIAPDMGPTLVRALGETNSLEVYWGLAVSTVDVRATDAADIAAAISAIDEACSKGRVARAVHGMRSDVRGRWRVSARALATGRASDRLDRDLQGLLAAFTFYQKGNVDEARAIWARLVAASDHPSLASRASASWLAFTAGASQ